MTAGQRHCVVPGARRGGVVDADRQGFQQAQEGADDRGADAPTPFGLNQHIACVPEPEGGHVGQALLQALQHRPGGGLVGGRDGHRRPWSRRSAMLRPPRSWPALKRRRRSIVSATLLGRGSPALTPSSNAARTPPGGSWLRRHRPRAWAEYNQSPTSLREARGDGGWHALRRQGRLAQVEAAAWPD